MSPEGMISTPPIRRAPPAQPHTGWRAQARAAAAAAAARWRAARWRAARWSLRAGLACCSAGLLLDMAGHAGVGSETLTALSAAALEQGGHAITLAGMLLILGTVVYAGVRERPRGATAPCRAGCTERAGEEAMPMNRL